MNFLKKAENRSQGHLIRSAKTGETDYGITGETLKTSNWKIRENNFLLSLWSLWLTPLEALVQFTHSKPYQKNDNAHIEEKNWTIVRQYLGNNRFDDITWLEQLNQIYTTERRLMHNFFMPSGKINWKTENRWPEKEKI